MLIFKNRQSVRKFREYLDSHLSCRRQFCKNSVEYIEHAIRSGEMSVENAKDMYDKLWYVDNIDGLVKWFSVEEGPKRKDNPHRSGIDAIYGAVYGDIIGSGYEGHKPDSVQEAIDAPNNYAGTPTDDTVLTLATMQAIEKEGPDIERKDSPYFLTTPITLTDIESGAEMVYPFVRNPFTKYYKDFGKRFPEAGYGSAFYLWLDDDNDKPYGSMGNGSAMRVSPCGAMYDSQEAVIQSAAMSAMATHNHMEGVKGAVVTAMCIWMAKQGYSKEQIFEYMRFHYSYGCLILRIFSYREASRENAPIICPYTVPAAVISFFEASSFVDTIEKAACVHYDTDTTAAVAGSIAGAYYGIKKDVQQVVLNKLAPYRFEETPILRARWTR